MMERALWWLQTLSNDAPSLPQAWAMQQGLTLGWTLLLALVGALLGYRMALAQRRLLAAGLALWTLLPGAWSPDYWLGLAFHSPSLSAMLLWLFLLQRLLFPAERADLWDAAARRSRTSAAALVLPLAGVLLGYALLLDTFAVLPFQLYAWGFSPVLLMALLALSLLPWVIHGAVRGGQSGVLWLAPTALLLFAATRLPTGNVWDALLDPWLWFLLQVWLLRRLVKR
jgi:hypothetical protein